MKYFCVTPCLDAEEYIKETMLSVIQQTVFSRDDCTLYYVIRDGGSSDSTVNIVNKITNEFINKNNIKIVCWSEKDSGMYDALAKGFKDGPVSDVYSYINAGDFYSIHAFEIVYDIFSEYEVYFLTGINTVYNSESHVINFHLPFEYNKKLLLKGLYGTVLPFIQQESTFWDNKLHKKIDFNELKKFKYAGDYYLWKTFINEVPLYIVSAWLGGFRRQPGQLSSIYMDEYKNEIRQAATQPTIFDFAFAYLYRAFGYLPNNFKKKLSSHMFEYDHIKQKYCLTKDKNRSD